ncbi:MAG: alpha/beta fold hydrolase [Aquihabitans sp.]
MTEASWLLLHGTPMSPEVWDGVGPILADVRPVLAPQLRTPHGAVGAQAELAAAVLDDLPAGGDGLHVVGHSFGGQVAIEVALLAPERVRSLTILCSRAAPFPAFAGAAATVRSGSPVDVDGALARWFRPDQVAAGGAVVDYVCRCLDGVDRELWADELDAIAAYDRTDDLARIAVPVTLIAAELDQVGTVTEMAGMADRIPDARFELVTDAAHMSPFLEPAALAARFIAAARAG